MTSVDTDWWARVMAATASVASSWVVATAARNSRTSPANWDTVSSFRYGQGTPITLRKLTTGSGRSSIATLLTRGAKPGSSTVARKACSYPCGVEGTWTDWKRRRCYRPRAVARPVGSPGISGAGSRLSRAARGGSARCRRPSLSPDVDERALEGLKFSEALKTGWIQRGELVAAAAQRLAGARCTVTLWFLSIRSARNSRV